MFVSDDLAGTRLTGYRCRSRSTAGLLSGVVVRLSAAARPCGTVQCAASVRGKNGLGVSGARGLEADGKRGEPVPVLTRRVTQLWPCSFPDCHNQYSTQRKRDVHARVHIGDRPYCCLVEGCAKRFYRKDHAGIHAQVHLDVKRFGCPFEGCKKRFGQLVGLRSHLAVHTGKKPWMCPIESCGQGFSRKNIMQSHLRLHAQRPKAPKPDREYFCPVEGCGKRFLIRQCKAAHMRNHSVEQSWPCPVPGCDWQFRWKGSRDSHLRSHARKKRWLCPVPDCGKSFVRQQQLPPHLLKHGVQTGVQVPVEEKRPPCRPQKMHSPGVCAGSRTRSGTTGASGRRKSYPVPLMTGKAACDKGRVASVSQSRFQQPFASAQAQAQVSSCGDAVMRRLRRSDADLSSIRWSAASEPVSAPDDLMLPAGDGAPAPRSPCRQAGVAVAMVRLPTTDSVQLWSWLSDILDE